MRIKFIFIVSMNPPLLKRGGTCLGNHVPIFNPTVSGAMGDFPSSMNSFFSVLLPISWNKKQETAVRTNRMDIRYLQGYKFVCQDKPNPKESCDVRTQYSSIFPLSSNQDYRSNGYPRGYSNSHSSGTRQTLSTHLPDLWSKGFRGPQLDSS